MPLIQAQYSPPRWLRNPHVQTIVPALFRRVPKVPFQRERFTLSDNDFVDLDWLLRSKERLTILTHGLEGSSTSPYISAMAHHFLHAGSSVLAWNFRGCSGEPNRTLAWYHSGKTEDLREIIDAAAMRGFKEILLVGFSVGGNIVLKYLGESEPHEFVKRAAAISVPTDVEASARQLEKRSNALYMRWFLSRLKQKIRDKLTYYPEVLSLDGFSSIRTFHDFDSRYTAPLNGFDSPEDYWRNASSAPYLELIRTPTLLLTARDDPFLCNSCFPTDVAQNSSFLHLELCNHGGHVGFMPENRESLYYYERRVLSFLLSESAQSEGILRRKSILQRVYPSSRTSLKSA